jgi:hypothetical protein
VFFGTPHRGAHGTPDIARTIGTVINACLRLSLIAGITGTTKIDLAETLSADATALRDLSSSFRNRLEGLEVVTFYENEVTPPLSYMVCHRLKVFVDLFTELTGEQVVERSSALMDVPQEDVIPLFANHVTMCKFPGPNDAFEIVSRAIRRLALNAVKKRLRSTGAATPQSSTRCT